MYMNKEVPLFGHSEPNLNNNTAKEINSKPRINSPIRNQYEMTTSCLDDLISEDHKVRFVWDYVHKLDMSGFIKKIKSIDGIAGRSATSPHLLLALWIYATIEGIGSGRIIERYTSEHNAFKWLCGGVNVNHHTITDFRVENNKLLDDLLTQSVAVFLNQGIINLERISQDGIRVRAHAASSSFRRKATLEDHYILAKEYVKQLAEENDADPSAFLAKKKAREFRLAKQKENDLKSALENLEKLKNEKEKNKKGLSKSKVEEKVKEIRSSTTDSEARRMKMANSGYSPAYNVQLATETGHQVVVGLSVTNLGVDIGQMSTMYTHVQDRFKAWKLKIKGWLVDGGYSSYAEIENLKKMNPNCNLYMPPLNSQIPESYIPKQTDSEVVREWRITMGTIEAKEIYKERASTSECVNAAARNRGLQQFAVRGIKKVTGTMLIFALTHNIMRAWSIFS